jgi:osmotically-inducible protein OsmY
LHHNQLDNDADWLLYAQGIFLQDRKSVDGAIQGQAKNGHVTLEGVVDSEADKNLAGVRANPVPGIFSVTNNLRVVPN